MSVAALAWAFEQCEGITATEKLVLLSLADHADVDGQCWPSKKRLAEKSMCDPKTVQRALKKFRDNGMIRVEERFRNDGTQTSNRYFLNLNSSVQGGTHEPPKGDELIPQGGTDSSPRETSVEPSGETDLSHYSSNSSKEAKTPEANVNPPPETPNRYSEMEAFYWVWHQFIDAVWRFDGNKPPYPYHYPAIPRYRRSFAAMDAKGELPEYGDLIRALSLMVRAEEFRNREGQLSRIPDITRFIREKIWETCDNWDVSKRKPYVVFQKLGEGEYALGGQKLTISMDDRNFEELYVRGMTAMGGYGELHATASS